MLELERRSVEGCDVVEIRGELDLTNTEQLDDALLGASARCVVVDLSNLAFVDSTGMRAIDQAQRRLARAGRTLLVVAPAGSRAAWTFRVAGYESDFVLPSLADALRRAGERPPA